jgi:hypothetical protein
MSTTYSCNTAEEEVRYGSGSFRERKVPKDSHELAKSPALLVFGASDIFEKEGDDLMRGRHCALLKHSDRNATACFNFPATSHWTGNARSRNESGVGWGI